MFSDGCNLATLINGSLSLAERQAMERGRKIEAVRLYRERIGKRKGMSLKEIKEHVEKCGNHLLPPNYPYCD